MRVAILAPSHPHLLDLAVELDGLGHDIEFLSLLPKSDVVAAGLPERCYRRVAPWVSPMVGAQRLLKGTRFGDRAHQARDETIDLTASRLLHECDAVIAHAGTALRTIEAAKRKFGAKTYLECGRRHIIAHRELLEAGRRVTGEDRRRSSASALRREVAEYELADTIVVPSETALRSFRERGFDDKFLLHNPYGAGLAEFSASPQPAATARKRIVTSGSWSLRFGSDIVANAWRALRATIDVELVHIGTVDDVPLPTEPGFIHHEETNLRALADHYARADVFCMGARFEGLAPRMARALATGLRVVCSDRAGGDELRGYVTQEDAISTAPTGDVDALRQALSEALNAKPVAKPGKLRELLGPAREQLSWRAYASRYHEHFVS